MEQIRAITVLTGVLCLRTVALSFYYSVITMLPYVPVRCTADVFTYCPIVVVAEVNFQVTIRSEKQSIRPQRRLGRHVILLNVTIVTEFVSLHCGFNIVQL